MPATLHEGRSDDPGKGGFWGRKLGFSGEELLLLQVNVKWYCKRTHGYMMLKDPTLHTEEVGRDRYNPSASSMVDTPTLLFLQRVLAVRSIFPSAMLLLASRFPCFQFIKTIHDG
jgi:hypothetical protein